MMHLRPDDEQAWEHWASQWQLEPGVIYLNHGSFGPPPTAVQRARQRWQQRMDAQPMQFFVRELEPAWQAARQQLAQFVSAEPGDLAFVENATAGMNVVADSLRLSPQDHVVLTDHEYGAVQRIWERACRRAGAEPPVVARVPLPIESAEAVVDAVLSVVNERTRLIVVSHITSATAITMPVTEICHRAADLGVPVCIDGPHAIAQLELEIDKLQCAFYTASCHKWLSAPFGSGFLYVHQELQHLVQPPLLSWGRLRPHLPESWSDEFIWSGTRDPSPYLAVPAAIDFLNGIGRETFAVRTHYLARYARQQLSELSDQQPLVPDDPSWYGSMAHVPLPPLDGQQLQQRLAHEYQIEVPIMLFDGKPYLRVSCHLYNSTAQIDALRDALDVLL